MKIEVHIEINEDAGEVNESVCQAQVIDPHGNTETIFAEDLSDLMVAVADEVQGTYEACALADEENASSSG